MISDIRFTAARSRDVRVGVIGYVRARYGELVLDGIAVRRAPCGGTCLSWPARRDRRGRHHALVRPLDDPTRRALEREILSELLDRGWLP